MNISNTNANLNKAIQNTDLPIGFIMSMAVNQKAMENFSNLDDDIKSRITGYIQRSPTGQDSKNRIDLSIQKLQNNDIDFFNQLDH